MTEHLIEVYDQLLELYELRNEAECRDDRSTLNELSSEIRELEASALELRPRQGVMAH